MIQSVLMFLLFGDHIEKKQKHNKVHHEYSKHTAKMSKEEIAHYAMKDRMAFESAKQQHIEEVVDEDFTSSVFTRDLMSICFKEDSSRAICSFIAKCAFSSSLLILATRYFRPAWR